MSNLNTLDHFDPAAVAIMDAARAEVDAGTTTVGMAAADATVALNDAALIRLRDQLGCGRTYDVFVGGVAVGSIERDAIDRRWQGYASEELHVGPYRPTPKKSYRYDAALSVVQRVLETTRLDPTYDAAVAAHDAYLEENR